ncbi:acyltransferase family protein [Rhizobium grahamii]|uniref:Acyltransferase 3 n=1 Tax=Rhizobium grahamii CCGE 502 TaxID=990285 RepID=S3IIC9_9HYPH|nr:acyltransferase family protein [Rhizobium grahamii]EPE98623.1 acyltransferase 3 [Rhizobium grahamii CCGE 502]
MKERVEFANTLRGAAAIMVLLEHYHSFFPGDRTVISSLINAPVMPEGVQLEPDYLFWLYSIPHLIWSSLGVSLFFIISGFVIPYSIKSGSRAAFLFGRFFRIYPLYAAGFLFTLASIYLTGSYFDNPWPFTPDQILPHFLPGMRELTRSTASIDGIIWTLEIEVKFYLICAFIAPWIRRASRKVFLVPVAIIAVDRLLSVSVQGYAGTITAAGAPFLAFMFIGVAFHFMYNGALRIGLGFAMISTLIPCIRSIDRLWA